MSTKRTQRDGIWGGRGRMADSLGLKILGGDQHWGLEILGCWCKKLRPRGVSRMGSLGSRNVSLQRLLDLIWNKL